jgi:fructan beta-fructosidase
MKNTPSYLILTIFIFMAMASCKNPGKGEAPQQHQYYGEQHRPQFHFTPDSMWMNDPNGMVFYKGEYHLFYQHHPHSNVWGPMHWGHAISQDLVHWKHLPIALWPDSLGTIFSGSAVIDWNNSSGLGDGQEPPMVAIFTHHNHELEKAGSDIFQYQSIAYSLDRGRSWTKYPGNPVLENPGIRDFRDPKVSWYEKDQKWLMVFAAQDRIMFYSSPNLIQWNKESEFSVEIAPGEGVWECPDFFPLTVGGEEKWVLLVSIGDGGPNGGSGTKYYVGDFDGKQFLCDHPDNAPRWLDFGKDNYAGVSWSDIPSEDG